MTIRQLYLLLTLTAFTLIVVSCKKENDLHAFFTGSVTDYYSNNPLPNIKLLVEKKQLSLFGSPFRTVDTIVTAQTGTFRYAFIKEYRYIYRLSGLMTTQYAYTNVSQIENEKNVSVKMKPFFLIEIALKNITHKYDSIHIETSDNYRTISAVNIKGLNIDSTIKMKIIPEFKNYISWQLYFKGNYQTYSDTNKDCDNSSTNKLEISY